MDATALAGQDKCTGCGACMTVCPTRAIEMRTSTEGFSYPVLNKSNCIGCGRCKKVCPAFLEKKGNTSLKICGLIHSDKRVWKESTSGGAFSAICQMYGDSDTVVFGASYNANTRRVEHKYVVGVEHISIFYGSKYVQSYLGDCFTKVAEFLRQGKKVVFTGTPCQVSGLKQTLHSVSTEKLLCIALVCNGVSSPSVLEQYILALEKRYENKVIDYKFRDKKIRFGIHNLYRRTIVFKKQRKKSSCIDLFNRCYTPKILCRRSCFNCGYSFENIDSDLTIGDFKKMYQCIPDAPYNKNGSIVVSCTTSGDTILRKLSDISIIYDITFDAVDYPKSSNGDLQKRNDFFAEFEKNPQNVISLLKKYSPKMKYKQIVGLVIPSKFKSIIKNKVGG